MDRVIFFCPHPDDELLIGGGLLYAFTKSSEWEAYVVYLTNGDYHASEGVIRLREAIYSCKELGVEEENIIFMGYGDRWKSKHPYNESDLYICESYAGRKETYALSDHAEWSFARKGIHNSYCRANMKQDLLEIITVYVPDILVCTDFDENPEHRALLLLIEEVMKAIILESENYHPLILTKLAYECVMRGISDYHIFPHKPTVSPSDDLYSTPILKWSKRISFKTPKECNTTRIFDNRLFKASCKHNTQNIRCRMNKIINSDIVFWQKRTDNLAIYASVSVSSGNGGYVNDFKTIDSNDICKEHCEIDAGVWIPKENDPNKTVIFQWKSKVMIKTIEIYENPKNGADISKLSISSPDLPVVIINNINHDGAATIVELDKCTSTDWICIKLIETTANAGLSEVTIYSNSKETFTNSIPYMVNDSTTECRDTHTVSNIVQSVIDYTAFSLYVVWRRCYMQIYKIRRKIKEFRIRVEQL